MTNLDELIEAERKRAAERITKLRRAAAAEQRRIDERVVALLSEQKPDLYRRLEAEAANALAEEKAMRSSRAKKPASRTSSSSPLLDRPVLPADEHAGEGVAS